VNKVKRKGRGCYAPALVPQPPKPKHIAQTVSARGSAYATRCTLQPLVVRQCRGDVALGQESTADVLLTKPSMSCRRLSVFTGFAGKKESRRADSNRLPLLQLRVIGHVLQGFAEACKSRINKRLSLLRVALCCTVLRSRWYQSGINRGTPSMGSATADSMNAMRRASDGA
jgi:hypothetical protein